MSIYHNLEQMKLVACAKAKQLKINMNVIILNHVGGKFDQSKGSTYEMVTDSYNYGRRANTVLICRTDDLLLLEAIAEKADAVWDEMLGEDLAIFTMPGDMLDATLMAQDAAVHFKCVGVQQAEAKLAAMAQMYAARREAHWFRSHMLLVPMAVKRLDEKTYPTKRPKGKGYRKNNYGR
jgi:hypothetical protein